MDIQFKDAHNKYGNCVGAVAQQIGALAAKSAGLGLVRRSHIVEGEG